MSEGQKYKKAIEKALKQFDGVDVDSDEFGYAIYPASDIRDIFNELYHSLGPRARWPRRRGQV